MTDFEAVDTITRGAFGIIELVRHIKSHKPYVLKKISKNSITKDKQVEHLNNEKSVCRDTKINKEFIVTCYDTFQDDDNLYFVMEFVPGGDLHSLVKQGGLTSLQKVKFYFAEVLLAIGKFMRVIRFRGAA